MGNYYHNVKGLKTEKQNYQAADLPNQKNQKKPKTKRNFYLHSEVKGDDVICSSRKCDHTVCLGGVGGDGG